LFKIINLQIISRYAKYGFSYQEKILQRSKLIFHHLKLTFKNLNIEPPASNSTCHRATQCMQNACDKCLRKNNNAPSKKLFSTWKVLRSHLASALL